MDNTSKEVKALARPLLRKAVKLQSTRKRVDAELGSLKKQLQSILDEFGLTEILVTGGKISLVSGSTRTSIHSMEVLERVLIDAGLNPSHHIKVSNTKPSLRITSL